MPLVSVLVVLIVAGVVLWLINTYVPMQPPIKTVLNVIVVLVLCLWLLSLFGIGDIYVGRHVVR
jgi:type IV secretory pathway TrbD component